jgi:hypothetical protein
MIWPAPDAFGHSETLKGRKKGSPGRFVIAASTKDFHLRLTKGAEAPACIRQAARARYPSRAIVRNPSKTPASRPAGPAEKTGPPSRACGGTAIAEAGIIRPGERSAGSAPAQAKKRHARQRGERPSQCFVRKSAKPHRHGHSAIWSIHQRKRQSARKSVKPMRSPARSAIPATMRFGAGADQRTVSAQAGPKASAHHKG